MMSLRGGKGRAPATPRPLDAARLEELALGYVARFGTTRAKLHSYLSRKLRERGWAGEGGGEDAGEGGGEDAAAPEIDALVERLAGAGYVDDAAYARAKSGSLLRRGYGRRRVEQALGAAGIDGALRSEVAPGEADARRAALALARKRGFGPFGRSHDEEGDDGPAPDRARRERQVAAMLRAGHPLESARALIDAATIADAEAWAYGADEDLREEPD
jgi:regulatory protein